MTQNQNPNCTEGQTVNLESCLDRTSIAILLHRKDYPLDYITKYFFPAETSESVIQSSIKADSRFTMFQTDEGVFVDRATTSITKAEREVQAAVEDWKNQMSEDFQKHTSDIKLCMLSQNIKRPKGVPKSLKLIDILNTDLQRRFLLLPSPSPNKKGSEDMMVKYKCTPAEVEGYHEEWRIDVAIYLLQQKCPIPLVTIGTHVAKPKNLGKNQKLIDVVKMDKMGRFDTHVDESHNSLTRLSVTKEFCFQCWRSNIYNLWRSSGCGALLTTESIHRSHPPAALSFTTRRRFSVWEMIVTDPEERFKNAIDFHVVLEKVNFDRQRPQLCPLPPPSLLPPRAKLAPAGLSSHHPSSMNTPIDSWSGARKASPGSERIHGYSRRESHPPSNYQKRQLLPQSYQYRLPPSYNGYPTNANSHHVTPTQAHSQDGYGRTHRTTHLNHSPQNGSKVISAASPPPGFGQQLGAPQACSAIGPAMASVKSVVSAASAAAAKVSRQLMCYDKSISSMSSENAPSQYNSNLDTDFSAYADPSPMMPGILNHIAHDSSTSKRVNTGSPQPSKLVSGVCTSMTSYAPKFSSLDELVASQFTGQDTAPGLLRFLSDTI